MPEHRHIHGFLAAHQNPGDHEALFDELAALPPVESIKIATALITHDVIQRYCKEETYQAYHENATVEAIFQDLHRYSYDQLNMQVDAYFTRGSFTGTHEHRLLIALWKKGRAIDAPWAIFNPRQVFNAKNTDKIKTYYLAGGIGTSTVIMTGALRAIHRLYTRNIDENPHTEILQDIARNSFEFIRQFAIMPINDLYISSQLNISHRDHDFINDTHCELVPHKNSYALKIKQQSIDDIIRTNGRWITQTYDNPTVTGCPALIFGSVKSLWNWYVQESAGVYDRIETPDSN